MKAKITVFLFIGYIFLMSILGVVLKDEEISLSERRKLKKIPEFTYNGDYVNKLDGYLLDHFPYRDTFRSIKANFNFYVLKKLDNNGIYLKNDYIFKSNYPTNKESVKYFRKKTESTIDLFNSNNNIYMMVVPDKNYYLNDKLFLKIDYDYINKELSNLDLTFIKVNDLLKLEDYYKTDTHWRQEKLIKVVERMNDIMNFSYTKQKYKENKYNKFYGVYYGESALKRNPDNLVYLDNEKLSSLNVKYLENPNLKSIYNPSNLSSMDSYEVYLDGASAFIEIENQNSITEKELIIFRDSFGSSLVPLLTPYYKKITIIDNRYIDSNHYLEYIDIKDQDVLFLYSTLLINESFTLKG